MSSRPRGTVACPERSFFVGYCFVIIFGFTTHTHTHTHTQIDYMFFRHVCVVIFVLWTLSHSSWYFLCHTISETGWKYINTSYVGWLYNIILHDRHSIYHQRSTILIVGCVFKSNTFFSVHLPVYLIVQINIYFVNCRTCQWKMFQTMTSGL
jgi:hypothetical protein